MQPIGIISERIFVGKTRVNNPFVFLITSCG